MTLMGMVLIMSLSYNDIHTYGNVQEVQVSHISLDLALDFEKHQIQGKATLSLTYSADPKNLDLDSDGLTLSAISDEAGNSYSHELGTPSPTLGTRLRIPLAGRKPAKLTLSYTTSPNAGALQWLSKEATTSGKLPFLFTQSQSIFTRSWIPTMDSPGVRVTYDATVRVPQGITAVMSAIHGKSEPDKGIFRFHLDQKIPCYLIALAAGELTSRPIGPRTAVWAEPGVIEKAAWEFADMEKMVESAERGFGPYRWGRWDAIVLPPSFPFGGMENPLLTFVTPTLIAGDRSLVSVMAHELAHSWSGNLVTNATWADFWLNEGTTTYIERRLVEDLYGKEIADMQKLLGQRDLRDTADDLSKTNVKDTCLKLDLADRHPDDGMNEIAYEKGANLLILLETHFGRAKFDAYLRKYFDNHAFQSITTEQALAYMKAELFGGDEALWKQLIVEQWVYQPGLPGNMVQVASDKFEKTKAAAAAFAEKGDNSGIQKNWITAEWLDFLNSLPSELSTERLDALDKGYNLSKAGNSEILFAWLMVAMRNSYEPAYASCESFLTRQGRRKFLKPIYQTMQNNPKTLELGKSIYAKARKGYHPIAQTTIDAIVK
jgi:leukotriene-A4 hydrolase